MVLARPHELPISGNFAGIQLSLAAKGYDLPADNRHLFLPDAAQTYEITVQKARVWLHDPSQTSSYFHVAHEYPVFCDS
jgi:hypothetical protein